MQSTSSLAARHPFRVALLATLLLAPALLRAQAPTGAPQGVAWKAPAAAAPAAPAGMAGRDTLTFGYFPNARPISFRDAAGNADGYAVALCRGVAAVARLELKRPDLRAAFVPVGADAMDQLRSGRIDVLCAPIEPTLARRAVASFSLPIFYGGTSVMLRRDGNARLRALLEGRETGNQPIWRGSPQLAVLNERRFAVISGTASDRWARGRKRELGVTSTFVPVPDLATGLRNVASGAVDGFIGDRSVLLDAARNDPSGKDVVVLDRVYDHAPLALALHRGDEDLRLLVDQTLSRLYRTGRIDDVYGRWFGKPDAATRDWFRSIAEPE